MDTTTERRVLFTTREVCSLCDIPVVTLNWWVKNGSVMPEVRGGVGRGRGHRFAAGQLFALALVADTLVLAKGQGSYLGKLTIRKLMQDASRLDDSVFRDWLKDDADRDDYEREVIAARVAANALEPVGDLSPGTVERMDRVLEAIRQRLLAQTGGRSCGHGR